MTFSRRAGREGRFSTAIALGLILCLTLFACAREKEAAAAPAETASSMSDPATADAAAIPADMSPAPSFDSARAMQYVKEIVAFGPRPLGSANHKKVEDYFLAHLKGDMVENDTFTADTPEGKFPVHNIVAKFPGKKDGIIVIASHYDTNYPLRKTSFVGANDGGS